MLETNMLDTQQEVLDDLFKNTSPKASKDIEADEIILIVDRSGSMSSIVLDAQGGINSFIEEQKKEGNANLTMIEFDHTINPLYKQVDIKEATEYTLKPRGSTALYDAIGATLANADSVKTTGLKIVVIVTDGGENASSEWTQTNVFERIESLKEAGWDFLFLAANQDAMATGMGLGIEAGETVSFAPNSIGTQSAYLVASTYTSNLRGGMSKGATMDALDADIINLAGLSKSGDDVQLELDIKARDLSKDGSKD